jgi:excisionase family DNA binding protein
MKNKRDNAHNAARTATPRFFTISDVADFFDVSSRSVRRWIKSGDLPVHRFGGVVRISDSDLRAFAATHREE